MQLCGWLGGVWNLWTVSDLHYIVTTGILAMQEKFADADTTSSVPFSNLLDKGYRCSDAAWRKGQLGLQLRFAKSQRPTIHNGPSILLTPHLLQLLRTDGATSALSTSAN